MDKDLLWSFKMVLLDGLESSSILKESLTLNEDEKFRNFIKGLTSEQAMMIFELTKEEEGPFKYDVDSPKSLKELGKELADVLKGGSAEEIKTSGEKFRSAIKRDREERGSALEKIKKQREEIAKKIADIDIEKRKTEFEKATDTSKDRETSLRQRVGSRFGIKTKIAIGLGIATLLAIGAYYIYKRYKDECRKQCKGSTDPNCLKKCRTIAARSSISKLQVARSACGSDQKCIAKSDKEIKKWQVKLVKIEREDVSWGVTTQRKTLASIGKLAPNIKPSSYSSGSKKIIYSTPRKWAN